MLNKIIGCGSLTDGQWKIEVHIMNFNEKDYHDKEITKGDKVQVIGTMQSTEPPYFLVKDISDIKRLQGRLSLSKILEGSNTLKKKSCENNLEINF